MKATTKNLFALYYDDFIKAMKQRDSRIQVKQARVQWYFSAGIPISQAVEAYIDWEIQSNPQLKY